MLAIIPKIRWNQPVCNNFSMSALNDAVLLTLDQWFGVSSTATNRVFASWRTEATHLHKVRNVGYPENPTAAASRFTPSGRTCRQPPRRDVTTAGTRRRLREEEEEGDHGGGTTQGDSLSRTPGTLRTFPPLSGVSVMRVRRWPKLVDEDPRCAIKDARRTPVPPTKEGTGREF